MRDSFGMESCSNNTFTFINRQSGKQKVHLMIKLYALGMNTYNFGTWVRNIVGHRRKNRRVLKDLCQWYCRHHCFHTAQKSMAILNEELEKRLYEKYESLRTYLLTVVV